MFELHYQLENSQFWLSAFCSWSYWLLRAYLNTAWTDLDFLVFLFYLFTLLPRFVFLPSGTMLRRNLSFSRTVRPAPLLFETVLLQFLQIMGEKRIILKAVPCSKYLVFYLSISIPSDSPDWCTCCRWRWGSPESWPAFSAEQWEVLALSLSF